MKKFFLTLSTVSFLALNIVVGQIYIDTGSEELENTNTNVNTTTTTVKSTSTNVSTKNIYVPANGTENTKSTTINTTTSNKNRVIQSEPRVFTSNEILQKHILEI